MTGIVRLTRLAITDFRNIAEARFELPPDGIAAVGDNGQGKTNLLEAIGYLELLRSIRGARDRDLVRFSADAFHVAAEVDGGAVGRVGVGVSRTGEKRVSLDGVPQERMTDALGSVPSVCFAPADVSLVGGGPSERRRFLDVVLALTDPAYLSALRHYRAALVRRNAALRARGSDAGAVRAWEPALATHGATLVRARHAWAEHFTDMFASLALAIGERLPMGLTYSSAFGPHPDVAQELADALGASRDVDRARGATQCGPHRDDLALTLAGRSLKTTGSAGQHRTAAIALRLVEAATFRARTGRQPLVLLDDPFAELDRRRAALVLALIEDATDGGPGQVILCVPRAEEIPDAFTRLERWRVEEGVFRRAAARGQAA